MKDRTIFVNLSSAGRDRRTYPDSSDCILHFEPIHGVKSISIRNFEVPHTREAVDETNNTLYLSENTSGDVYNFYSFSVAHGPYTANELASAMTIASSGAYCHNSDSSLSNTYTFVTSGNFGKLAVVSSGDVPFNFHTADDEIELRKVTVIDAFTAKVDFFSHTNSPLASGALLILHAPPLPTREVQVVAVNGNLSVTILGDVTGLDGASKGSLLPVSRRNGAAAVLGFGDDDESGLRGASILGVQSPFESEITNGVEVLVGTSSPHYAKQGGSVYIDGGIRGFMGSKTYLVAKLKDATHLCVLVDRRTLWSHTGGTLRRHGLEDPGDPGNPVPVSLIEIQSVDRNVVTLLVTISPDASSQAIVQGDELELLGFDSSEWLFLRPVVTSIIDATHITIRFVYPASYMASPDVAATIQNVNASTGHPTTFVAPYRFDLSRGRRMMLVRATVDNSDMGSISIPAIPGARFFGRVQLFSGGNLVNFLDANSAVGSHSFNATLNKLRSIRFAFLNEDGTPYGFSGVDYTIFLEVTVDASYER
jgi:hypothetical protein